MNTETISKWPRGFKAKPDDINVLEMEESRYNERLMTVAPAIVKAIGEVFEKHNVTHEEYQMFRDFLVKLAAGPMGTIGGISDVWLEPLFDKTKGPGYEGTPFNPEGPLYAKGVPLLDKPPVGRPYVLYRRPNEPGERLLVRGRVFSLTGKPLTNAELDLWQASDSGLYSTLGFDDQPDWNLRGRIVTDDEGRYEFLTIKPPPYCTPGVPDVIYEMTALMGKANFRPAHIHFHITHQDLPRDFFTQIYFRGDPYIEYDLGLAASDALAVDVKTCDSPSELKRLGLAAPFRLIDYDFRLETKCEEGL